MPFPCAFDLRPLISPLPPARLPPFTVSDISMKTANGNEDTGRFAPETVHTMRLPHTPRSRQVSSVPTLQYAPMRATVLC